MYFTYEFIKSTYTVLKACSLLGINILSHKCPATNSFMVNKHAELSQIEKKENYGRLDSPNDNRGVPSAMYDVCCK